MQCIMKHHPGDLTSAQDCNPPRITPAHSSPCCFDTADVPLAEPLTLTLHYVPPNAGLRQAAKITTYVLIGVIGLGGVIAIVGSSLAPQGSLGGGSEPAHPSTSSAIETPLCTASRLSCRTVCFTSLSAA